MPTDWSMSASMRGAPQAGPYLPFGLTLPRTLNIKLSTRMLHRSQSPRSLALGDRTLLFVTSWHRTSTRGETPKMIQSDAEQPEQRSRGMQWLIRTIRSIRIAGSERIRAPERVPTFLSSGLFLSSLS